MCRFYLFISFSPNIAVVCISEICSVAIKCHDKFRVSLYLDTESEFREVPLNYPSVQTLILCLQKAFFLEKVRAFAASLRMYRVFSLLGAPFDFLDN